MKLDAVVPAANVVFDDGHLPPAYQEPSARISACWQFGVIAPRRPDGADGEPWFSQTECVVRANAETLVHVRVRVVTIDSGRANRRTANIIPIDVSQVITRQVFLGLDGLRARLAFEVEPGDAARLRFRLENHEEWRPEYAADRDAMLRRSLVSAHLVLGVEHGEFISPPGAAVHVSAMRA